MIRGIFAGSFDPVTYGHLDIINRSLNLFNEVIVAVGVNQNKKTLFSIDERVSLLRQVIVEEFQSLEDHIHIYAYDDLTVNLAKQFGSCCLIRGVRSASDYDYEVNVASINKKVAPGLETVLLLADPNMSQISSSAVKELAKYDYENKFISKFVPPIVVKALNEKRHLF